MSIGLFCIIVRSESKNPRAPPIVFHSGTAGLMMEVRMCRSWGVRTPNIKCGSICDTGCRVPTEHGLLESQLHLVGYNC